MLRQQRQQRSAVIPPGVAAETVSTIATTVLAAAGCAACVGNAFAHVSKPSGGSFLSSRATVQPPERFSVDDTTSDMAGPSNLGHGSDVPTVPACASLVAFVALGAAFRRVTRPSYRARLSALRAACRAGVLGPPGPGLTASIGPSATTVFAGSGPHGTSTTSCFAGSTTPAGAMHRTPPSGRCPAVACKAIFERFTAKSMKAVMLAQGESRRVGVDHVGTEMLVVGVLAEGSDVGASALQGLGVELQRARAALQELVGRGAGGQAAEIPFTQGAKQILEDAVRCASSEDSVDVTTAHLLHAIIMKEEEPGAKLLGHLLGCTTPEALRQRMLPLISKGQADVEDAATKDRPPQTASRASSMAAGVASSADRLKLTETLKYAEDLTKAAVDGKLEPLVGRQQQLERTVRILGRRSKNNPVLVGEAGVGKTSIAHGLAQLIAAGRVPPTLKGKRVLQLDLALLLAGTRYRGDFEERLRAVVQEVTDSNRQVILVIDEVHTLVGAGSSGGGGGGEGGGIDAANLLKPALARGELQCIGATTLDEYRQYIESDPALERRFQPVLVPEPSEDEAEQILLGLAPRYERHHQLRYTPEALRAAVKLASRYISDRYLPDKAIDVMDEAGSKVRQQLFQGVESAEATAELSTLSTELEELQRKKRAAVMEERFELAQQVKLQELELQRRVAAIEEGQGTKAGGVQKLVAQLQEVRAQVQVAAAAQRFDEAHELKLCEAETLQRLQGEGLGAELLAQLLQQQVTEEDVAQVVSSWTGIAVEQVSSSESARLMRLEELLHESIVGQQEAVRSVSRAFRRARAGLRSPERPIASFIFSGPTGVGKTALCKTLAATFFGSADAMIRLDMSEFMERHTVSKLVGAPPGYVGYGEGGTLTEAVRRKPYSLVLFDEVEKAHPDVFNLLLQLLDDGKLTDSKGRTVSFANTLVVLTSNIGSRAVQKGAAGAAGLGFGTEESGEEASYSMIKELVHEEMKGFFRPEFLNRLDETVVFRPLTREDVRAIAEIEFKKISSRLRESQLAVSLTDRFKEHVVQEGFDPAYGARPLRRAITRLLEDRLAEHLLAGDSEAADREECRHVELDVAEDGKVRVRQPLRPVLAQA